VPPGIFGYPEGGRVSFADMDLAARRAEARRLLEEAGYGPDRPLSFTFEHRNTADNPRIAVVAQSDWRSIAPWVEVRPAGVGGWIPDSNLAYTYLFLFETRTGPQNYCGYSNPEYDRLMESSVQERDLGVRAGLMRQAEQLMLDDSACIPVAFGTSKNLIDPRIRGYRGNLEDIHRTRWMTIGA